jgi:hypothetical protein
MHAAHHQPAAAIDPRTPTADGRDRGLGAAIVEGGRDLAQRRNASIGRLAR